MNLLDSSAWLEFFADGPRAAKFAPIASEPASVLVPTILIYEVFKVVMRERGETESLEAADGGQPDPRDRPTAKLVRTPQGNRAD